MAEEKKERAFRDHEDPEDRAVIDPRGSVLDPRLHDPVVLCPVGPLVSLAARVYKARKRRRPLVPASVYSAKHGGRRFSLVGPAMGAPASAYVLERVIANHVGSVVMLGLCGSISEEVRIGDLVVPDWGVIDEGTSKHYVPGAKRSSATRPALAAVRETIEGSGRRYHLGPVWTIDAVFRETRRKVQGFAERGVLAVEMEASALFTVARYRGIDLAALLVVSDELYSLTWKHGFTRPRFLSACRQACHLARDAAIRLYQGKSLEEDESHGEGTGPGEQSGQDGERS